MDPEQVEAARQKAAESREEVEPFKVWEENADIVRVFTNCQMPRMVISDGFSQRIWTQGIAASEIRNACELLNVDRTKWADVIWGVRVMEAVALAELNKGH